MSDLKQEDFELICGSLRQLVDDLVDVEGLSLSAVLVVIHAEAITGIAGAVGGAMAAQCARRAADRVEGLKSVAEIVLENPLAVMPCRGNA